MTSISARSRTPKRVRTQAWEVVYEYLRDAILTEELGVGERLIETAIAERVGVSQGPVREALARLGEQGLVTKAVGSQGRYVSSVPLEAGKMIYSIRGRIEPLAAQAALQHIQATDLDAFAQDVEDMRTAHSLAARLDADMSFHRRIYELSDSTLLLNLWEQMESQMRRLRPMSTSEVAYRAHYSILEALRARDNDLVEKALDAHMRETWIIGVQPTETSSESK